MVVTDISGDEDKYTLDSHGFQLYRHTSVEKDFRDDAQIKAQYYPEVEQLIKDAYVCICEYYFCKVMIADISLSSRTGAARVFVFDHTVRRPAPPDAAGPTPGFRGPVTRVHIDQTYIASINRVAYHLPQEAEKLLQKRFQIINVSPFET